MTYSEVQEITPFLLPLVVIQLILIAAALIDLKRRANTRGPKWMWVLIILFVNIIGPIIYFTIGKGDE